MWGIGCRVWGTEYRGGSIGLIGDSSIKSHTLHPTPYTLLLRLLINFLQTEGFGFALETEAGLGSLR